MQKLLIGFFVTGTIIIGAVFSYFTFFVEDESKIAEVVLEEKMENKGDDIKINTVDNIGEHKNTERNLPKANFSLEIKNENLTVKSGNFIKIDGLHYANGEVIVEKVGENYKIKMQNNFSSAEGPDLFVYLSEPQNFKNIVIGGMDTKKTLNLGVLKNIKGQQEYLVSKNDFEKYNAAVIIWCKQFGIQFSRADLK